MFAALALAACFGHIACAGHSIPETQPGPRPAPLAGPLIAAPRATIVRFDLSNRLVRPDRIPEEEALAAIPLSESDRLAGERVLLRRARLMDAFVSQNFDLVHDARKGGVSPWRGIEVLAGFFTQTQALRERGCLWEQVRAALSPAGAAEFDRVMLEYWDAVAADRLGLGHNALERFAVTTGERLAIFGAEMERSYQTIADSGSLAVTALTVHVELSAAQRARVREFADAHDAEGVYPPSDDQKKRLLAQVLSILTEDQRAQVLNRFRD